MLEGFEMVVLVLQKTYRRDEVRTSRGKKNFGDLTICFKVGGLESPKAGIQNAKHTA